MTRSERITRDDIEKKLRGLQGEVAEKVEDRKGALTTVAVAAGVAVVIVVFLVGRRSGRRRSTMVEIRRL
ncbi:MAG: hypothetical protein ACO2Y7_09155 [Ilumatobacteraceae bacterium]|jgi:hypothetical protein|nr:hypothetical protein [Actinomycetota bacterium]MDA3011063.1 hypothetical protein [Actinomycetota bacterium]MDA3024011.1 hypothetical protein [Actinomycetota bacterium]NBU54967.1 hypothetical protein [Acidimicrobiia bacterium]